MVISVLRTQNRGAVTRPCVFPLLNVQSFLGFPSGLGTWRGLWFESFPNFCLSQGSSKFVPFCVWQIWFAALLFLFVACCLCLFLGTAPSGLAFHGLEPFGQDQKAHLTAKSELSDASDMLGRALKTLSQKVTPSMLQKERTSKRREHMPPVPPEGSGACKYASVQACLQEPSAKFIPRTNSFYGSSRISPHNPPL